MAEVMLPPNSHKYREMQESKQKIVDKGLKPVVSAPGTLKKKSFIGKIADSFFAEDIPDLKSYLFYDIFIPSLRDMFDDLVCNGVHSLLYGNKVGRRGRITSRNGVSVISGDTAYNSMYRRSQNAPVTHQNRSGSVFDPVVFRDRTAADGTFIRGLEEAEKVRAGLFELFENYEIANVADVYQLSEIPTTPSMFEWGWRASDLKNLEIRQFREGHEWAYLLDLPTPKPINSI